MPFISGGKFIEGGYSRPYVNAGAPTAGTNEVQTLTIGGTPTGGTFKLTYDGFTTTAITWSATNATLLANINAALDALTNLAASAVVATAGTLTAGIGTVLLTFSGEPVKARAVNTMTVANNSLTGTSPTLAIVETTPGVDTTGRGAPKGGLLQDSTNGKLYVNTGTDASPTWTVVGTQT
jgi:hypothetical protein